MKPTKPNRFVSLSSVIALGLAANASAADLYWDANGATAGTGGLGTWSTADTWRDGSSTGTLGSWADGNSAIFGGTTATVTVSSAVTVNQLKFLTTGYTIGAVGSGPLFFGGSYSDLAPTIDTTGITPVAANRSTTISSKITGTLTGGLVIRDVNNITTPGTAGRLYLNKDSASDFSGDITVLSGNLHALSNLGDAANKVILKGGALFGSSSSAITYQIARSIDVAANSAIGLNATATGVHMELASGKTITGTFNLTRYATGGQAAVSELRLLGDMSGYTGTFENTGGVAVIQTTATSGGAWKLTGGTLILNTTDNTHIADGAGKSALLMNGSTLDMNGKSETINGLSGATGIVQNQAAATASVLTVGSGDATASFGGTVRDNSVTGGTLALTKTGTGIQTLGGFCSYTGATTVNAGTLVLGGTMNFSPEVFGMLAALGFWHLKNC